MFRCNIYLETLDKKRWYIDSTCRCERDLHITKGYGSPFHVPTDIADHPRSSYTFLTMHNIMLNSINTGTKFLKCRIDDFRIDVRADAYTHLDKKERMRISKFIKKEFESVKKDAKFIYKTLGAENA